MVQRERPPAELVNAADSFGGLGFPSGHAFQAVLLFGILAFLASDLIKNRIWRRLLQGALVMLVIAIGISRVYLGAHWTSDVVGGYLWGTAFLLVLWRLFRSRVPTLTGT
ncbi:MAG: phosphatase PAP2 family protein [Chloroflexi bacterium]|nr:phosphatase PAP2 family protein [Chloroflexota bacterium]